MRPQSLPQHEVWRKAAIATIIYGYIIVANKIFLKGVLPMSKQKALAEVKEQIVKVENDIRQGENKVKRLLQKNNQQERKDRTRRLIERGAIVESIIKESDKLTNEQIKKVLYTGLNSQSARDMLSDFRGKNLSEGAHETAQASCSRT